MQVWVLTAGYDYEGEELLSVHSSLEAAEEALAALPPLGPPDRHTIYEVTVDGREAPKSVKVV